MDAPIDADPPATPWRQYPWRQYAPVFLGLTLLVLWNIAHKSIWVDEAYSLNTAGRGLGDTVRQSLHFELQPPLYFLLLNLWLRLNHSVEFARGLSMIAALGGVAWLVATARRLGSGSGLRIAILAALTPAVVWTASETRTYALVFCLVSGTQYYFVRLLTRDTATRDTTRVDAICYALLAYASVMAFYYSGFALLGQAAAALLSRRARVPVFAALIVVGVGLVPWLGVIAHQAAEHPHFFTPLLANPSVRVITDTLATQLPAAVFAGAPLVMSAKGIALAFVGFLALVVARVTAGEMHWGASDTMLALATLLPIVVLLLIRLFDLAPVTPRHLTPTIPGLILIVDTWLGRLRAGVPRTSATALVMLVLGAALVSFERNGVQRADWRSLGDYLTAHAASDELVLVINPEELFPFRYVYHGKARVEGLVDDARNDVYVPMASLHPDSATILKRVASFGWPRRVWLVDASDFADDNPARVAASTFEARHTMPISHIDFLHVRATYATLTPPQPPL